MALAYVNSGHHYSGGNVTLDSFSYTVGSGPNTGLIAFVNSDSTMSSHSVQGVKVNGVYMTEVEHQIITTSRRVTMHVMPGVTAGIKTINIDSVDPTLMDTIILEYSDVNGTPDPYDVYDNGTASGNITLSLTTLTNNDWLVSCVYNSGGISTAGTGTTIRETSTTIVAGDSNGAKTPPGSFSMVWNGAGSAYGVIGAFEPFIQSKGLLLLNVG